MNENFIRNMNYKLENGQHTNWIDLIPQKQNNLHSL